MQDATQMYGCANGQLEKWELLSLLIIDNTVEERLFLKSFQNFRFIMKFQIQKNQEKFHQIKTWHLGF